MTERVDTVPVGQLPAVVGIIGGTGAQGRGLATRWSRAGVHVVIGSRDADRAAAVAADLLAGDSEIELTGDDNHSAAQQADLVVVAVPWAAHDSTLAELRECLAGRLVVDCVNPLGFDERGPFALRVPAGSAVEQASQLLPASTVVGAFHHVSSALLLEERVTSIDCDVMVVGDDRAAVDRVISLAELIPGLRGRYAGRLRNAGQVEALTANLIAVNRRYRTHSGIRITGVED